MINPHGVPAPPCGTRELGRGMACPRLESKLHAMQQPFLSSACSRLPQLVYTLRTPQRKTLKVGIKLCPQQPGLLSPQRLPDRVLWAVEWRSHSLSHSCGSVRKLFSSQGLFSWVPQQRPPALSSPSEKAEQGAQLTLHHQPRPAAGKWDPGFPCSLWLLHP